MAKTVTVLWNGQEYGLNEGDNLQLKVNVSLSGMKALTGNMDLAPITIKKIDS